MTNELLSLPYLAGQAGTARATVAEIVAAAVHVTLPGDTADEVVACDVLVTGPAVPAFAVGDEVLVWRGAPEQRGVVLGRIGPPGRSAPAEVVIEAGQRLSLKCGDGSITLRADGKVAIKGRDLLSHAKRANRIKGGSVAIN